MGETLADKEDAVLARKERAVMEYPLVRAIMEEFKGAKIESLIRRVQEQNESVDDLAPTANNDLNFDEETD